MKAVTENSTEKALAQVSENKPISVYSINFARVIDKFGGKRFIVRRKPAAVAAVARNSFSGRIFSLRNVALTAAILAIGVLHFAFQVSVIRPEVGSNRPAFEVPPVTLEPVAVAVPAEIKPVPTETKKANPPRLQLKKTAPGVKTPQVEIVPSKPQSRKKETVETRTERLRRAEKILTGI